MEHRKITYAVTWNEEDEVWEVRASGTLGRFRGKLLACDENPREALFVAMEKVYSAV